MYTNEGRNSRVGGIAYYSDVGGLESLHTIEINSKGKNGL